MERTDLCNGCVLERQVETSDVCKTCSRRYTDGYQARQTPRSRALEIIQNGQWWNYLPDGMPDDVKTEFLDAMDIAVAALLEKKDSLYIHTGDYVMSANVEADDNGKPRFSIVFENEKGMVTQDICLIQNDPSRHTEFGVECFVYGDAYSETYTNRFHILKYAVE